MKSYLLLGAYLVTGFFMFALHAATLDAPTLVVQEYSENFLSNVNHKGSHKRSRVAAERAIHSYLEKHMQSASPARIAHLGRVIDRLANRFELPPGLILSVIKVESDFQAWAVSSRGAVGLMQIMPETGEWLASRCGMKWTGPEMLLNEEANLTMGVHYLAYLRDKYEGDLKKMLVAYNQGPAKVDEDVSAGKHLTLEYYHKIKQYLPRLALASKNVE